MPPHRHRFPVPRTRPINTLDLIKAFERRTGEQHASAAQEKEHLQSELAKERTATGSLKGELLAEVAKQISELETRIKEYILSTIPAPKEPDETPAVPSVEEIVAGVLPHIPRPEVQNGKDGVAPSPEEVANALFGSKKFLKFIKKAFKPGKDGELPATDTIVALVLEEVGKRKITLADVDGLEARIAEIRNHVATRSDNRKGGGGDTVAAGANVTLSENPNGDVVINASGGVGAWQRPPEAPNGVITVFTVGAAPPTDVVADGVNFYPGAGYTYAAGQVIFDNPPAQYVRYR